MNVSITLPILSLRDYQRAVWNYLLQEKAGLRAVTVWPRRNGKDLTAVNILTAKACQRQGLYQYIAPYANQIRAIIWDGRDGTGRRFVDYIPVDLIERKLDNQMKIWLKNGSIIHLVGSDNPDAVVGTNPLGQVYTEFSLHKPGIWQYMRPVLAENGGWALFNGTPRGLNHFYQLAQHAQQNQEWFYQELSARDTGFPSEEDIDKERAAGMPESLIQQEFYVSWLASSEDVLIPLDAIKTAMDRQPVPGQWEHHPRIIGVDPAYAVHGDRAVIARRQGPYALPFEVYQGMDPMALADRVAAHIKDWKANYVFVDAGRGEAVWSRLGQLGHADIVVPVNFGGAPYNELYARVKDMIWDRMKQWVVTSGCLPKGEDLVKDLSAPTFIINDRGKLELESKKQLRSRGVRSTDLADALALTFSEEIEVSNTPLASVHLEGPIDWPSLSRQLHEDLPVAQSQYSPLEYMEHAHM